MKPRLLANENVPAPSIQVLRESGFDVLAITESGTLSDAEVLALARDEQRWIVTFDRDYGELIFARGLASPPAVILFRIRSYRPAAPGKLLAELLESAGELEGQFVIVEDGGLRKRPLPEPSQRRG